MRRQVMSFRSFASDFDGTDAQAYDAYEDFMHDVRSGKEGLDVQAPTKPRVDWDRVRRESEAIDRAARAYVRVLDPWSFHVIYSFRVVL